MGGFVTDKPPCECCGTHPCQKTQPESRPSDAACCPEADGDFCPVHGPNPAPASGIDRLLTQMQETGRIPTGASVPLGWLLGFLGQLGINPDDVRIDVSNGWIEVVR
jgi:hypothetical protein